MSVSSTLFFDGRPGGGKFKPGTVAFEALWIAAERIAALLKSA
jgi:hypothetical protein